MLVPRQTGHASGVTMENEEDIVGWKLSNKTLIPLGWIHTHPTQTCFLSSVDLHQQYTYQREIPESVALVLSPKKTQAGIFSITQLGMEVMKRCGKTDGFHTHNPEDNLFMSASHAVYDESVHVDVTDLRESGTRKKFLGIF